MEERRFDYVIRDQDGNMPRTLDLLQGWGPPLRPPLRAQVARWLIRVANWLYTPPATTRPPCFLTCAPQGHPGHGGARGSLSC